MLDGHIPAPPPSAPASPPWPHWPATQVPFTHTAPAAQALPHAPQFWLLSGRCVQMPLHSSQPVPMSLHAWHVLPVQKRCPVAHGVLQSPQWLGSELMSVQVPLQSVCHDWQTHAPLWQDLPPLHTSPEAPHPQMPGCTHLSPGLQPDVGWLG
jgi:hypothetical protein